MIQSGKMDNISDPAWSEYWQFVYPANDSEGNGLEFTIRGCYPDFDEYVFPDEFSGDNPYFLIQPEGSAIYPDFLDSDIFCGPFRFVKHISGDLIILNRFDDWYGWSETFIDKYGHSITYPSLLDTLETIHFRFISSRAMRFVELETGGIDWLYTSNLTDISQYQELLNVKWVSSYFVDIISNNPQGITTLLIAFNKGIKDAIMSSTGIMHLAYCQWE